LGCVLAPATVATSTFGGATANVIFTANTATNVRTTAHAAVTIVFMGFHVIRTSGQKEAQTHAMGRKRTNQTRQVSVGIRLSARSLSSEAWEVAMGQVDRPEKHWKPRRQSEMAAVH
jgi:hypothetical protein